MRKRLLPRYLRIAQMAVDGYSNQDIALAMAMHENTISQILNSEPLKEYFELIKQHAVETSLDVTTKLQGAAPLVADEIIDSALRSPDPRVRFSAQKTVLEMAGHVPVKRHEITRPDSVHDKYKDMSPAEIRQQLLDDLENVPSRGQILSSKGTLH